MKRSIAYYVTAHGYGHGVRSSDILNALQRLSPHLPIHVVSGLPEAFLRNRVRGGFHLHNRSFDSGMTQLDSVRVDLDASLVAAQNVIRTRPERIASERQWLRQNQVGAVVCDIPSMPLEAAHAEGIPALAVGNFSWAWIYSEFSAISGWREVIDAFAEGYSCADAVLRLPFSETFEVFRHQIPVSLLARPGQADKARLAQLTGADPGKTWVLLSFTTLDWREEALAHVRSIREVEFFTLQPLAWQGPNLHAVDRDTFTVPNLFASVDAVLTKPGYGVVSECIANRKPMIYVDREHFRETPLLVEAIRRNLRQTEISSADLYAGCLLPAIESALSCPAPPDTTPLGGDEECARIILDRLAS